ncbi:MAG: phosphoribosylformylglycinamidine synthase I [Planctomycetota bacterium]
MALRTLIIRTAGTNCDQETKFAFERAGSEVSLLHINRVNENPSLLGEHQILALPGGFSYGDDIASGKVLANELLQGLADQLKKFVDDGKLVIGICNGFQVLVKTGLLPGPFGRDTKQTVTLTFNDSNKFEDRWVYLRADSGKSPFIKKGEMIYLPVAHGEGKFLAKDDATLDAVRSNGQVVFRYVNAAGEAAQEYPINPNGSADDVAGICDTTGRVLGLMPHPERHVLPTQHPRWTRDGLAGEGDGMRMFRNAVQYFA